MARLFELASGVKVVNDQFWSLEHTISIPAK
jgi:hypothetical protein